MIWSNWQGALWRGAGVMLLFWSGLAWTQTSPRPAGDPAERIMVVHEPGKESVRCRVLESWPVGSGKIAHLLEVIATGERITIVDEEVDSTAAPSSNPRGMPKRIWAWGLGRQSPPKDSPVPPHMRQDSGIVIKNEPPAPPDGIIQTGGRIPDIKKSDEKPSTATPGGPIQILPKESSVAPKQNLIDRIKSRFDKPAEPQVMEFQLPAPPVVIRQPKETGTAKLPGTPIEQDLPLTKPPVVTPSPTTPRTLLPDTIPPGTQKKSGEPQFIPSYQPNTPGTPTRPNVPQYVPANQPDIRPAGTAPGLGSPLQPNPVGPKVAPQQPDSQAKKPWRPGSNIQAWLENMTKKDERKPDAKVAASKKTELPKPDLSKVQPGLTDEQKKLLKAEELLAQQNKMADKLLQERVDRIAKAPLSTAQLSPPPNAKRSDVTPALAIPNPAPPKDDNRFATPPPEAPKTAEPKRDMWGIGIPAPLAQPGRSLLDTPSVSPQLVQLPPPPQAGRVDPLMHPERFNPTESAAKPKASVLPPVARADASYSPDQSIVPPPYGYPPGAQSVLAAKSGMVGPVTYVPQPIMTVPQPGHAPQPPAPVLPDAPNLNAHVNAFTPPPIPMKQEPPPWQMAGAFQASVAQQQILAQQQQMLAQQQQMLAQQAMMYYGHRPNPYMINPYMQSNPMMAQYNPMPSSGPTANFSRYYAGPMPPNSPMQAGYGPMSYPHAAQSRPMMMPQQPTMQPVSHQQVPTQQQSVAQQVDQLVKALRENPYPAQREWAAQSLGSYDWRAHPQIIPALLQSASQDPAGSVRAGCVYCLGRMNAAVEPVFTTLHSLRNDIDPRVRQEVEGAFTRMGQTPMPPQ